MLLPWQGGLRRANAVMRGRERRLAGSIVEFDRVGLRYGTGGEVLRDLDFRLSEGGFYFLTGPSGAGKTSLLKLLYLAQRPTRGRMSLFGDELAHAPRDALPGYRRRIGVVFQDFRLIRHLSAFDNVALRSDRGAEASARCAAARRRGAAMKLFSVSEPDRRLIPSSGIKGPVPLLIAIMTFVMVVVAAAGLALGNTASVVKSGVENRFSIQIADGSAKAGPAIAAARSAPGRGCWMPRAGRPGWRRSQFAAAGHHRR